MPYKIIRQFLSASILLLLLALSIEPLQAQNKTKDSGSTSKSNFTLNPDDIGALENSINLFTGQVVFPLNLVSLPSNNGLGASVTIQYNSAGVNKQINKDNLASPTGVLGLGWSLELPRIICDHKQTGTREDDEYYLVENGSSIPLLCIDASSYPKKYAPKQALLWKIEYYSSQEKWVITKENGFKVVYGDEGLTNNGIQYMVKWKNWIGNSVQPTNQSRLAYIWNLSSIENLWGKQVQFKYEKVEEFVAKSLSHITNEKKHTQASYLKEIISSDNSRVEFLYGEKVNNEYYQEYIDPHQEKAEPDAYQEKFETRYLDRVITHSSQGKLLYEIDLEYSVTDLGEMDIAKRLLKRIRKIYPSGYSMPPTQFDYFLSGEFKGALKKVTNSYGAFYEYTYQTKELPDAMQQMVADAPDGFEEPYHWVGSDYVVVVWRKTNTDGSHIDGRVESKVHVYTWDGKWNKQEMGSIYELKTAKKPGTDKLAITTPIVMGGSYFAFLAPDYQPLSDKKYYDINIFFKELNHSHTWKRSSSRVPGEYKDEPVLLGGEGFLAVGSRLDGSLKTYTYENTTVSEWRYEAHDIDEFGSENYLGSGHNYIIVHNDDGENSDKVHFFFLKEDKQWLKKTVPQSESFETDGGGEGATPYSHWAGSNSFATVIADAGDEYIYQWDENYSNFKKISGLQHVSDDGSIIDLKANSMVTLVEEGQEDSKKGIGARYDGYKWHFSNPFIQDEGRYGSGEDYYIYDTGLYFVSTDSVDWCAKRASFDPNQLKWLDEVRYGYFDQGIIPGRVSASTRST